MKRSKRLPTADARNSFRKVLRDVQKNGQRIRVTRYGRTMAGIIPKEDLDLLEKCEEHERRGRR